MKLLSTLLFVCFLSISAIQGQDHEIIDLTTNPVQKKQEPTNIVSGHAIPGMVNHQKNAIPLKVQLLSIDKTGYAVGEQIVYAVQIENMTQATIAIPCVLDMDEVAPNGAANTSGYLEAVISLVVKDEHSNNQYMTSKALYGAEAAEGSLRYLSPGKKITIKVLDKVTFTDTGMIQQIAQQSPQTFQVHASFTFFSPNGAAPYQPLISQNSLSVQLRKRKD